VINLGRLTLECHAYAKGQGFWDVAPEEHIVPAKLMLIVSEVAEAMEAHRNHQVMAEELADIIIRVCDLAGARGINLEEAVLLKMEHNKTRQHLHGKRY